ncbi:MAG: SapC family protein [Bdellovibrionales bacterium]
MSDDNNTPDQDQNLPMFYKTSRPLDIEKDAGLRVSSPTNFSFAAKTNAIPVLIDEFPLASSNYPIVFAPGDNPVPAVVVGLEESTNLFIDLNNQWLPGTYLPAYVRRYPFLLMDDEEQKQYVLCIDETSDMLGTTGEYELFKDGKPSSFTQGAMNFCAQLRQQGEATDEFASALKEYNLLKENNAEIDLPAGTKIQLAGFKIIDPKKFDLLPDKTYLEWRRKGWIGLIFSHLLSTHRWQNLVALKTMRENMQ